MGRRCELANKQRRQTPLQFGFYLPNDACVNESFCRNQMLFTRTRWTYLRGYSILFGNIRLLKRRSMPITARQKRVLDYIKGYFQHRGEAPTIAEIGKEFGMSSSASVHHVVSTLEREGFIRRIPNVSRGIQLIEEGATGAKYEIPLLGVVAAGAPIEAVLNYETVSIPRDMMRDGRMFALRVRGDSMIDEQIRDNDFIILQSQQTAENGQTV